MDRNEAINEVRSFIGQLTEGCQEAIRALVPELKESEDERIRKAIGAAICGTTAISILEANGTNLPDALSYLEKQKEKKPAEWSLTDATFIEEIDETLFMAETGRNEVVKNQIERERNFLKSLPERFNLQPKQEWSEEDKYIFWPLIDPDIPAEPYCRECLDKAKMRVLIECFGKSEEEAEVIVKINNKIVNKENI